MKHDPQIRNAVDESLSSVHFDARDMHRVLRAVREQEEPAYRPARRTHRPLEFMLTVATAVLVIVPVSLFALRAQRAATTEITTVAAQGAPVSTEMPAGREDVILATPAPAVQRGLCDEHAAIEAARACFEAQCDTTVFTFDEYAVDVSTISGEDGISSYVVTMESIYGNGCSFRVTVSAADGSVLSSSSPQLATVPIVLDDRESPEVQAWYDRYGDRLTWPLDVQAEFSRRYEGAMRRMPKAGDVDTGAILEMARQILKENDGEADCTLFLSLFAERAFEDGVARYRVYAFPAGASDADSCIVLTMRASDGALESSQTVSASDLQYVSP